jgi:hypothetical protein
MELARDTQVVNCEAWYFYRVPVLNDVLIQCCRREKCESRRTKPPALMRDLTELNTPSFL